MSAAVETYRDDLEATYAVDFSRDREPTKQRARFPEYRRRGSAPSRVSGMLCRRNKRWTWGSGRGARTLNMRAFAGAIAFAVASVASSVLGIQMDMVTIGNPGNPGIGVPQPLLSNRAPRPVPHVHRLLRRQCMPLTRLGADPRRLYSGNRDRFFVGSRSRLKSTA